ncbi:hypothetical protein DRO55_00610 [Candidatus Bathyarchaeota archaeon]|nr:MAG: hypothetical protein DRO55_00610 [Candidatus Bathyarchaeota archaeon]
MKRWTPQRFILSSLLILHLLVPHISILEASPELGEYAVSIQALNLDGNPVPNLNITVYGVKGLISAKETNDTGWATFRLEAGNYTFKALWHGFEVGSINGSVTNSSIYRITCRLVEVQFEVLTLANETVSYVDIEIYNGTDLTTPLGFSITNRTGFTPVINLMCGVNYTFKGFLNEIEILSSKEYVDLSGVITLTAQIANMNITITDEDGDPLPDIEVSVQADLINRYGSPISREISFKTNITGSIELPQVPVNANYTIEFSRNGVTFNEMLIDGLSNLMEDGWVKLEITCRRYLLSVKVLDSKGGPIPNVHVMVCEWMGRTPIDEGVTNTAGNVTLHLLPGRYTVSVYNYSSTLKRTITLNETKVTLANEYTPLTIKCEGFNLALSVVVLDYLGQPIPNAVVDITCGDLELYTLTTRSDGTALQEGMVSGNYRITVRVYGRVCEVLSVHLEESRRIELRINSYIMILGYPFEVGQLVSLSFISLVIISFMAVFIYKRVRGVMEKSL